VVTFLFTDVEGSTRRWETDAEAMRTALAAHDGTLRETVAAHGGFLFKHTGDGICAAFSSPRSAVDTAISAQRALKLPVRMGLATGEAEVRGGDYFGTVLNRAARVMAAGHGGQILVAESTAVLLSGVDLVSLGPRRLRDVPIPIVLYQVRAPGLATDFPPLRARFSSPGNLRRATTSLIGRESHVEDLALTVGTHRLVTLTGVGGVGKTRLATEVAARLAAEYPDGIWLFELAAVTDPAAVPDAVAATLGIAQQPGKTVAESVAAAQEGRIRLLVFDNCEHVRDAAADLIDAILADSDTVRIVATSREGLGLADEQLWLVPSLDVRSGVNSSAVALFAERTNAVSSGFSLDAAEDIDAVVEICRRLDGMPLAIELAASRMASMTAREIRDRLDQRFRLLIGSRRGIERHHTLRHAVGWSYELLSETEKVLLARYSVFSGGFDLRSACAVAETDDEFATLNLLDALVRKSLLNADRSAGSTRFSMLETIRQFAEDQLVATGTADAVRAAHASYFASREADLLALWDGPGQRDAYSWFTTEFANLRAAFRWAADHGDLDAAISVAWLAMFFGVWVEQYEPVTWCEEIIAPARAVRHRRLAQLYVMAAQSFATGRVADALTYFEAGEQLLKSGDFDAVPYEGEYSSGVVFSVAGHPEQWVALCRRGISEDAGTTVIARASLCIALYQSGKSDEAATASQGLLTAAESTDNPNTACFALLGYGTSHINSDPIKAFHAYRRALTIARETANRQMESTMLTMLGIVAANENEPFFRAAEQNTVGALDYLSVAIRRYHDAGNVIMIRNPLAVLAALLDRLGRKRQAAIVTGFALSEMVRSGYPQVIAMISQLREVLGEQAYESLAREGEAMSVAAIVSYAHDQIDQLRTELGHGG
jgi:predicted ATPase